MKFPIELCVGTEQQLEIVIQIVLLRGLSTPDRCSKISQHASFIPCPHHRPSWCQHYQASVIARRAVENGPCTGSSSTPGVCIQQPHARPLGGTISTMLATLYPITSNAVPRSSAACEGVVVSPRIAVQAPLTELCPGPACFKCCVPGGEGGGSSGPYPTPAYPAVVACKGPASFSCRESGAKVREIYCTRDCSCPGTSDHCCGLAIDFMCTSAGAVSALLWSTFYVG